MKEYKIYIIIFGLMFIAFNAGMIALHCQTLMPHNQIWCMGIFIHSCAILVTIVFCYFSYKEKDK